MKSNRIEPTIGEGIFLVTDIAKILHLSLPKVRRWLNEFWNNRFGTEFGGYSFGYENNAVNFYTFIEFITFAQLREHGLSAQKIQKIHSSISRKLNTRYPFAKTKLLTDGKGVWHEIHDELEKLDGKNQLSLKQILGPFLNKIEFDKNDIAIRYFPMGKDKKIVIDPKHQFGEPTIYGTNIKANIIYSLYNGKESKRNICDLYDITMKQVNDAIVYCKSTAA